MSLCSRVQDVRTPLPFPAPCHSLSCFHSSRISSPKDVLEFLGQRTSLPFSREGARRGRSYPGRFPAANFADEPSTSDCRCRRVVRGSRGQIPATLSFSSSGSGFEYRFRAFSGSVHYFPSPPCTGPDRIHPVLLRLHVGIFRIILVPALSRSQKVSVPVVSFFGGGL